MYKERPALSPERELYLKAIRRRRRGVLAARLAILFLFFVFWELAARYGLIDPFIMSQPSRILAAIADLYRQGELFTHIGISCLETVVGFLCGTLTGVLIATALWWSPFFSQVAEPYLVVLNALPKVALGPVFIVWMGAGAGAIVAMTLAISLIVTVMEVLAGFLSTDAEKLRLLESFGATRLQLFCKVVLPANLPTVVNSLKVNMGLSWVGVIMGEFLVSRAGIGYLIVYGSQVFQMDLVMTSVIILTIAAALMYQGVRLVERHIIKRQ